MTADAFKSHTTYELHLATYKPNILSTILAYVLSIKFYIQDVVRVVSDVYYLCSFDSLAAVLLFMNSIYLAPSE